MPEGNRDKLQERSKRFQTFTEGEKRISRAERFGKPAGNSMQDDDKLKRRIDRFGIANRSISKEDESRRRLRGERFGVGSSLGDGSSSREVKRAERFMSREFKQAEKFLSGV